MKFLLTLAACLNVTISVAAANQPNILWLTCEDTSPHLGCYGDGFATTPRLDTFAKEAVRYTHAFAYTGVCAPSRSCLITGVYPLRLGTQHMRSTARLPAGIKCFPAYLRAAGYYCTNDDKEDYNFATPKETWDGSGSKAHWRNRAAGQPFFAVFNYMVSHQSRIFSRKGPPPDHDAAAVPVPPIHPDIPEFRTEWARHYDNLTVLDSKVAAALDELEQAGLAQDTIVFFFSDHGTGMPAIKGMATGPSIHVPLLIRFPEKWRHLAPSAPGGTTDRLVSFVDFAPTVLSLANVAIPGHMQGTPFLGAAAGEPRKLVFGGRDRLGECSDITRYIRDRRFQYNRNFRPELPFGQYMSYFWNHASTRAWENLHRQGELHGAPARFFAPQKPVEELYDTQTDPWQVNNLVADPAHASILAEFRSKLSSQMKEAGDLGLLPEREMHARAAGSTPYEIATNPRVNPLDDLVRAADLANRAAQADIPRLIELLKAPDSAIRWWGALGFVRLGPKAASGAQALEQALNDPSPDVRLAVSEALADLGKLDLALPAVRAELQADDPFTRLSALSLTQRLNVRARPLLGAIAEATLPSQEHKDVAEYISRMANYLPKQIGRNPIPPSQ
jgi:uncharacterized sulfatase